MYNKATLIGNLGQDPDVRHLDGGRTKTSFSLATSESYKNKDGQRITNTEWHNIVLWGSIADIAAKYLKKGNPVHIEGKITSRSYEDRTGAKRYITEVVGRELTLLPRKQDEQQAHGAPAAATPVAAPAPQKEADNLPF